MKHLLRLSLVLTMCVVACTDEDKTKETLRKSGFTDVQTTGYDWFACSEDDTFHTGFVAKNPQGQTVKGVVCCGWWKSCTVRF